jgi:hypothetical protein
MTRGQSRGFWGAICAGGVALTIFSIYIGIENSEKLWGILGGIGSIAAVVLSAYQIVVSASPAGASQRRKPNQQIQKSGEGSVNIQSSGDVNIGNNNRIGRRDG